MRKAGYLVLQRQLHLQLLFIKMAQDERKGERKKWEEKKGKIYVRFVIGFIKDLKSLALVDSLLVDERERERESTPRKPRLSLRKWSLLTAPTNSSCLILLAHSFTLLLSLTCAPTLSIFLSKAIYYHLALYWRLSFFPFLIFKIYFKTFMSALIITFLNIIGLVINYCFKISLSLSPTSLTSKHSKVRCFKSLTFSFSSLFLKTSRWKLIEWRKETKAVDIN